jgi:integrase
MLTDKALKQAIQGAKEQGATRRLSDGNWLTLLITSDGKSRWQQRYRYGGKERTFSHGSYPLVSIAEARQRAQVARNLLAQGTDPVEDRRNKKAQLRSDVANTFGAATESWYQFNLPRWKHATAEKVRQYLDKDFLPLLGKKPLKNITTQEIISVIEKMESRGASNAAKKAVQWFKAIFEFAIAKAWRADNPTQYLSALTAPAPSSKNHPHLSLSELPSLLAELKQYGGSEMTKSAIWLALWTANRPGVTRTARWSEIDFDKELWVIGKDREGMKGGYAHVTPLPSQAIDMLRRLHRMTGHYPYVFTSRGDPNQPMSDAAVNKALATMGFKGRQTGHGFRHLVSTALNEAGYEPDWIERQLAHGDPDKIRGTYNKALYVDQRRTMMQAWADRLSQMSL